MRRVLEAYRVIRSLLMRQPADSDWRLLDILYLLAILLAVTLTLSVH